MVNVWKITAIVFIGLFVLSIMGVLFIFSIGVNEINNDSRCAADVCNSYEAYYYGDGVCYCYNDGVVKYKKYMG